MDPQAARALVAVHGETRAIVAAGTASPVGLDAIVRIVPADITSLASRGNLIGVVLLALLFGTVLSSSNSPASRQLLLVIEGLFEVSRRIIDAVVRFAPIAVGCFMFDLTVMFGWALLTPLAAYTGVVLLALAFHAGLVFSIIVWIMGGMTPPAFFRGVKDAAFIAFSTSSSNATLPTALTIAETKLGIPAQVARFVLGVGTAANQNGSAIYEAVTVVFLAQLFGVSVGFGEQLMIFLICMLGGIGTAGVPAGALPVVSMLLGMIALPPEAIALVLGVDRLLDMCRTAVNVVGDLAIAVAISRERQPGPIEMNQARGGGLT